MSIAYQSLFGTSSLDVDDIHTTSMTATSISVNALKATSETVTGAITNTALTASRVMVSSSTKVLSTVNLPNGNLIIGNNSGYTVGALSAATSNMVVTNGAGTISLDINTNPTFNSVKIGGTTLTAAATTLSLKLPVVAGLVNQTLTNDGSGNLLWSNSLTSVYYVNSTMTLTFINSIINNTSYSVVEFEYGTYNIIQPIYVSRNNITLIGNNSLLKLDKFINTPIIFVGDNINNPPTTIYDHIAITGFRMDGQKGFQTSETMVLKNWIYNNCIGINYCMNVLIKDCQLDNSISGGLTITYQSKYVNVENCYSTNNKYDAYTAYGSSNLVFSNNHAYGHTIGAGFSLDINCQYVAITNNVCTGNKLALFTRYCNDFNVTGNVFSGNTQQGLFIAGNYEGTNIGPNKRWVITGNVITNNGLQGMFLQSCSYFSIVGNTISGNNSGIRLDSDNATHGLCSYNVLSDNVLKNTNESINCGTNNTYALGARQNILSMNVVNSIIGTSTACSIVDSANRVSYSTFSYLETTSATFVPTGLRVTIQPRYLTSKVKVSFNTQVGYSGYGFCRFTIYRGDITDLSGGVGFSQHTSTLVPLSLQYTDSPGTMDAIIYELYFKVNNSAEGTASWNGSTLLAYCDAEEIF